MVNHFLQLEKKVITLNGRNRPIKDFISIPEEVGDIITAEEKRKFIDVEDEDKEVEAPNEEEQENRDDALNGSEDSGSDYISEADKERIVAEQTDSSEELNITIIAQRTGYPGVTKLGSSNFKATWISSVITDEIRLVLNDDIQLTKEVFKLVSIKLKY
jgi:hypothetical protein